MTFNERVAGWKTLIVNGGLAFLFAVAELVSMAGGLDWRTVLPAAYVPYVVFTVAVANVILRLRTRTAVGVKPGSDRAVEDALAAAAAKR